MCFARRLREERPDASILFLVTDRDIIDPEVTPPHGAVIFRLTDFLSDADLKQKQEFVYRVVKLVLPRILHIINSDVGWSLVQARGAELQGVTRTFGSMFAVQRDYDTGEMIGYAASYYASASPYLEALLSDNKTFFHEANASFPMGGKDVKLITIYNPVSWSEVALREVRRPALRRGSNDRPRFLWAGRLDRQKRVEVLFEIAERMPDCDFSVFGSRVTDGDVKLLSLPNVDLEGPFTSIRQILDKQDFDAFIFTTREEGMPNILIEIGDMAIPIVAPAVGGIPELITSDTGYLLSERPRGKEYAQALRTLLRDKTETARRAANLQRLIDKRHSWAAFSAEVAAIPHYLN
jgi:glycosyltransferase involved in cell wall biosynthesis